MSNREIVTGMLSRLPEDAPLKDIVHAIEFLGGIEIAREQVRRGETISVEEARKLVKKWAAGQ